MLKNLFLILAIFGALALTGCKTTSQDDINDPFGNIDSSPEIGTFGASDYALGDMPLNVDQDGFYDPSNLSDPAMRADAMASLKTIYFDFNSSVLRPEEAEKLKKTASFMKKYPTVLLKIEGHCDVRGEAEYNMALGSRRAMSILQYLADLGVSGTRLFQISYGKERPVDTGYTEEAHAKNRRGEFLVKLQGQ